MRYAELVQRSEPLETVKQIRESGTLEAARRDVETFVISQRMAGQLRDVIFANLAFDRPGDQKGLLTVATYGTGKTHLMSVVAGVAEYGELARCLSHPGVADAAGPVAGRFKVVRFDIGATEMGLREIVCAELQRGLARMGVHHRFPDWATVTNTKDALVDMMASFEAVHPDRGLLFVLDEMLDYLRLRRDAELIQDLVFLREVGEICRSTRFRFLSGVQEAIFDNPRFAGVADIIRRVRDRFEQVRISREDVAFVVEQRLLRKDATQRARIAEHLQAFTPMYEGMAERLDRFVALFPVHPDYLRTFEQITLIEKREVLRTIEREMAGLADQEVPADAPGLICADSYRARLVDDPSARTIPEVQVVLDKSGVLRDKVAVALPERHYIGTALRIIDGLTVHRLTTDDIHRPIGMTPEMLRDELCLLPPGLPEHDAFFLRMTVESIVRKVLAAVSGQFLSIDPDNGQVYLDVTKDIDYDQQIDQRAESLDPYQLDDAFYLAMEQVLGIREDPYVAGYRIWAYDLPWAATNADRRGYLFMGAPNERSTAQPPRDFYVYFLQPFQPPVFTNEERSDEVFIELRAPGDEFTTALRRYAGATAKAKESTATHRPVYEDKARQALQQMVGWLRSNMGTAMAVTHEGATKPLAAWLASVPGERSSVADQIAAVSSGALARHFATRYPGYPRFGRRLTPSSLEADVRVALTQVASRRPTTAGTAILDGLQLLDLEGAGLRADGNYADALLATLARAGGKVVNRTDLLAPLDSPEVVVWGPWHLEPAWLMVVAAALCQLGKLDISVGGQRIDALALDRLSRLNPEQLAAFDHLAPPRSLPVTQLRQVAGLLDLAAGVVPDTGATEALVRELLTRATDLLARTERAARAVVDGAELWGDHLFELAEERARRLDHLRAFLLDLKVRDSVGKVNSLSLDSAALVQADEGKAELAKVEAVLAARDRLAPLADYLREACGVFGAGVEEAKDALCLRSEMVDLLHAEGHIDPARVVDLRNAGEDLRRRFADLASRSYRHDHLDAAGDARKRQLLEGPAMAALDSLQAVSILAPGPLGRLRSDLVDVKVLIEIDERALATSVQLPGQAQPRPIDGPSAAARLEEAERRAHDLLAKWRSTLADSLAEPEMAEQIEYLAEPGAKAEVETFAFSRDLPHPVTPGFVAALNQVFQRVDIHHLSLAEVGAALFPDTSPATADQLRQRLDRLIVDSVGRASTEQVRFLPEETS